MCRGGTEQCAAALVHMERPETVRSSSTSTFAAPALPLTDLNPPSLYAIAKNLSQNTRTESYLDLVLETRALCRFLLCCVASGFASDTRRPPRHRTLSFMCMRFLAFVRVVACTSFLEGNLGKPEGPALCVSGNFEGNQSVILATLSSFPESESWARGKI